VILAIPPNLVKEIDFNPSLPVKRVEALKTYFMGSVIKCYAVYNRPFWREKGLNGLVATDSGYISVCFDNSPRDAEKGMIMGFVLANKAKEFRILTEDKRRSIFIDELIQIFGPQAADVKMYRDKIWADEEWSGGCYAGMKGKGGWTVTKEHISSPIGNIHFAGTETATEWYGYMEGAVIAGKRAAVEVMKY
jgi:monoamine oxidase